MSWQPLATAEKRLARAKLYQQIRAFFASKAVLEVETPLIAQYSVTDTSIHSLALADGQGFCQTSPEYAMKRLLAAGSGPIYQLGKAFRAGEQGRRHNPEFTLLEWYQPGYDAYQLMAEVAELIQACGGPAQRHYFSYQQLFLECLAIDPLEISLINLQLQLEKHQLAVHQVETLDKDACLDLLLTQRIEPMLADYPLCFITNYPASQAALAQLNADDPRVAERFECYFNGVELANGFHELSDANEQRRRFLADNQKRNQLGLVEMDLDEALLAALQAGLPDCSGVALGVDRLLMQLTGATTLAEVLNFMT